VLHHELPGQVQPGPDARLLLVEHAFSGGEGLLEGSSRDGAIEAFASVGDHHDHALGEVPGHELHGAPEGRIPACIVEQLTNDGSEPRPVGHADQAIRHLRGDRDPRVSHPNLIECVAHQRGEVRLDEAELEGSALELGQGDQLVHDPHQLVERAGQLTEELVALLVGDGRVLQDVGDPLGHRHRCPELVGDVGEEVGLGGGSLRHVVADGEELRLQLARAVDRPSDLVREQAGDLSGQRHRARGRCSDRAERVLHGVLLQHVAGGAGGEDLGDLDGVADHRMGHELGGGRGGEEPFDELRAAQTFERQLRHDHVGTGPDRRLHASEGIGRDLDLEIVLAQQVVLEARDLVGRVAEEHTGGHLLVVSAPGRAG
jgi:hypothetical protein